MGEISDILNQAKEKIQTGRAAINRVVDVRQGLHDAVEPYDNRFEATTDSYNEEIQTRLNDRTGLDREYTWGDYDEMQDGDEQEGERVEVFRHELLSEEDSVWGDSWGNENVNVGVDVLGYDAEAGAFAEVGKDRLVVGVDGEASAYLVNAEANLDIGPIDAGAEITVGASADANAQVNVNPREGDFKAEVGAGATVGVEATAEAGVDLHYAEAGASVTGTAGLSLEGDLDVGFEDWKFEFDVGANAALGLGGGFDTNFSIDGAEIASDVAGAGQWGWDRAGDVGGWGVDKLGDVGGLFGIG